LDAELFLFGESVYRFYATLKPKPIPITEVR
jgi:hypothetical protein